MGLILLLLLSLLLTSVATHEEVNPQDSCSSKSNGDFPQLSNSPMHLTLHHPRSPCSPAPFPSLPFSTILDHDSRRAHSLSRRNKKGKSGGAVSSPLSPGASLGVGNYVTKISLGTPSKPYAMVVDTGSSLSWLQCSPCNVSCHQQVGPLFDPKSSSSYAPLPCSSPECRSLPSATLNPSSCTQSNLCVYEASYGDSSFSTGYLSRDVLSIGGGFSLPNFIYGCGQDNEGLFGKSAGLVGLAKNKLSLLSQVAAKVGTAGFSYCLPTSSSTGYVSFGPSYPVSKILISYTPMVTNSLDDTLYFLKLVAVTVSGKSIAASPSDYSAAPTIIDSGTVITRLPSEVYSALSESVSAALGTKYKKAPAYSILDTCFVGTAEGIAVPEVSMVFAGGATMKLPGKNVMIDVDDETTCLAFSPAGRVAIIGNHQQQTFHVVYDVAKAKIGFAPGGCT